MWGLVGAAHGPTWADQPHAAATRGSPLPFPWLHFKTVNLLYIRLLECEPCYLPALQDALNRLAPEGPHYRHDDEGSDDMPAHIKVGRPGGRSAGTEYWY